MKRLLCMVGAHDWRLTEVEFNGPPMLVEECTRCRFTKPVHLPQSYDDHLREAADR